MKFQLKRLLNSQTFLTLSLTFLLASCGGSKSEESDGKAFTEAEEQILQDISETIADLPAPSLVPQTIQEIGAEYNPSLISPLHGMDEYVLNEDKAAMNLGIFSSDIGYLVAYDQVQESIEHMGACQELSEALGVSSVFSLETMERYEKAVGDHQKLMELLNETIIAAEQNLGSSDRLGMAALVLGGSFIEGLYLSVAVISDYHTDDMDAKTRNEILEPLVQLVLDQKKPLDDIIKLLRDIPRDRPIARLIAELEILDLLYEGDLNKIAEGMKNNPDFHVTKDMMFDLTLEITRIRNEIVEID